MPYTERGIEAEGEVWERVYYIRKYGVVIYVTQAKK